MTMLIDAQSVRDYLQLNTPASSSQYSDGTIGSNILAAQSALEQVTGRYFVPRTFTSDFPWKQTTMIRAEVPLPGFRTISRLTWGGGSDLINNQSYWLIPDALQTGVYTSVQFRAFRADSSGLPWWVADPGWYDRSLDNAFYPGNYGGGYFYSSMPNDLLIEGDAGYDPSLPVGMPGAVPYACLHAIKVLASFYTMRPASILADVAITPAGGVLNYSQMPAEVRDFIATWKGGQNQMVSVGG